MGCMGYRTVRESRTQGVFFLSALAATGSIYSLPGPYSPQRPREVALVGEPRDGGDGTLAISTATRSAETRGGCFYSR